MDDLDNVKIRLSLQEIRHAIGLLRAGERDQDQVVIDILREVGFIDRLLRENEQGSAQAAEKLTGGA
jgi:hypothetical protein